MLLSLAIVSIGGLIFWLIAARRFDADAIGRAGSLLSTAMFLSYLTGLGLPVTVARFGSARSRRSVRVFVLAVVAASLAGAVGAVATVVIDPGGLLDGLDRWSATRAAALLGLMVAGISVAKLVDARLMGDRAWLIVNVRAAAVSAGRLGLIWLVATGDDGALVFVVAAAPFAATSFPLIGWLARPVVATPEAVTETRRGVLRFAGTSYLGELAIQAPTFAVPVIVAASVSSFDNAAFFLAFSIAALVHVAVQLLAQTFLVESSKPDARLGSEARWAVRLAVGVTGGAAALSLAAVPLVRPVFGDDFGDVRLLLPLLFFGMIPAAVARMALTVTRLELDHRASTLITVLSGGVVIAAAATGVALGGTIGAATGWLVGHALTLIVSAKPLRRALADRAAR